MDIKSFLSRSDRYGKVFLKSDTLRTVASSAESTISISWSQWRVPPESCRTSTPLRAHQILAATTREIPTRNSIPRVTKTAASMFTMPACAVITDTDNRRKESSSAFQSAQMASQIARSPRKNTTPAPSFLATPYNLMGMDIRVSRPCASSVAIRGRTGCRPHWTRIDQDPCLMNRRRCATLETRLRSPVTENRIIWIVDSGGRSEEGVTPPSAVRRSTAGFWSPSAPASGSGGPPRTPRKRAAPRAPRGSPRMPW